MAEKKLQWQVAKPYDGIGKILDDMYSSLIGLVTKQIKGMIKDLDKAKKVYGA